MTLDQAPCIRQCAQKLTLFAATGFNKRGMTAAMVAAYILTVLAQSIQNPYAHVFDPSRSILHHQLFLNAAEANICLNPNPIPLETGSVFSVGAVETGSWVLPFRSTEV